MADYTVIWHTTIVDAESPEDAARQAHVDSSFGHVSTYHVVEGKHNLTFPEQAIIVDLNKIHDEKRSTDKSQ